VARLPGEQREVVGLFYRQSWTQAEVAEHLGVTNRTVQRHWSPAMLTLNELLKDL
jgi:DNA-directed RNA polymerase specialized sigma24 family protein